MILTILITILVTTLATIFVLNVQAGEKHMRYSVDHSFGVHSPEFLRHMTHLLGPNLLPSNRVTALQNGDEIFPAMLDAIRAAQESITFETFIYWSGVIGREFADALSSRARDGVKVHVLLDWVGSGRIEEQYLRELVAAGVEVERYHPLRWYNLARINNRTHRKILVIDGRVGFTGGVGIADQWLGHAQSENHWRDSHFRLEGPAVAQMQTVFNDNWIKTTGELLCGPAYFPELAPAGDHLAQVFWSSRGDGSESVRLMYLVSIASAQHTIRLQAAYFVPDDLAIRTLVEARNRGVTVEIILPGPITDARLVQSASRSRWGALIDSGVKIYEYQPTMYHCKVLIVDDLWASVGSTNFDDRSFRLNDEANLNVCHAGFAGELVAVFERDKDQSRQLTRAEFKKRPALKKCVDELAGILRRQL